MVRFSRDKQSFVSCSKDGTIRFYDLSLPHSHTTISMDVNVCGVHSNSFDLNQVAFGTAKGKFFIYDCRKTSSSYLEVKGHSKTVSNVIFTSKKEVLSMALDSTAKLWNVNRTVCTGNYVGHVHHTYFVGVDSTDKYIVMGGEDMQLSTSVRKRPTQLHCM